jgi:glycosyltransferase involved in cell wall biosynthesis
MGSDKMNGCLQEYVQKKIFQSRVHFLPPVSHAEVTTYVSSADIGIIPSQSTCLNYYYGLGNKIFHYIAAGVPVAVSNHPEKKRIVDKYGVGITFDSSNPKDIAKKTMKLLNDPELRKQMRIRARMAHLKKLNWEKEAQKIYQIYREMD